MKMTVCASVIRAAPRLSVCCPLLRPCARRGDDHHPAPRTTTSIDVVRIKSALQLTPAQERHWAPVEAALRELARRQERDANDGLVRRVSKRVVQVALNSATIHRLTAAARPLVKTFDEHQMQTAHGLAQQMGLGPVVAALK